MRALLFLLILCGAAFAALTIWTRQAKMTEQRYDPLITEISREYGVDPKLIRAVIWQETRFVPDILGKADERGLMQVTPVAGSEWAAAMKIENFVKEDLWSPRTNIQAGTWYLARALRRWNKTDNPIPFALAEYNAGRSNALRWVDPANPANSAAFRARVDFPTTRRYIENITQKYSEYQSDYFRPPWLSYWNRFIRRTSPPPATNPETP